MEKNKRGLIFDYNCMMSKSIGAHGIKDKEIWALKELFDKSFDSVQKGRGQGMTEWTELPYNQDEIVKDILASAAQIRENFKYFVVLGIGGSALGPSAVAQALVHLKYNDLSPAKRKGPKFFVEDNIDPERMKALLDVIDIKKTMFNVITKSGATSETMAQYLIIYDLLKKKLGAKAKDHMIATTDSKKGNLIKIARAEGFKTFFIPSGVGGRFSQLCPVGLLPAAVLGIDIKAMLEGAAYMDKLSRNPDIYENPALMAAALSYISMKKGKNISVMMPYADSLKLMADWYCQLWGESLGKSRDNSGNLVYAGQTPVKALGVTDQHSQLQLYTEGPFDKVVTFIGVSKYRKKFKIAKGCEDIPDVGFLGGHTLNELIEAERKATQYALQKAGRPSATIILPQVNAFTIGQLLYFFEMQTAFCGAMLDINAYDQPGVEEGKNATYALLGKNGYDEKRQELRNRPSKSRKYII
jgi:glucose-6-phosphate isomerase